MEDALGGVQPRAVFAAALKSFETLDTDGVSGGPEAYEAYVKDLIGRLLRLQLVTEATLLSANETVDDVPTSDLKYLLVGALIGDLYTRLSPTSPAGRLAALDMAERTIFAFLTRCDDMLLLDSGDIAALREAEKIAAHVTSEATQAPRLPPVSQTQQREARLAQFRREKELKQKLGEFRQQLSSVKTDDEDEFAWNGGDEDTVREYTLALIESFVIRSLDHLIMIRTERPMLRMRMEMLEQGPGAMVTRQPPPPQGKMKTVHITDQRSLMQAAVFQPGHNLPTLSIEQWAEREMAKGNFISGGGAAGEEAARRKKEEALYRESNDALDADIMKEREKDDYNDTHRPGSGNTYNRS